MFKSYQQFVLSKAAPPVPLEEPDFHLLHACLGLATEFVELDLADTPHNVKEELGDLAWYLMLTAEAIDFNVDNLPEMVATDEEDTFTQLTEKLEVFLSLSKKHAIYRKNKSSELRVAYHALWRAYLQHIQSLELDLDSIIEENKEKLNKRYATAFTTQESEERRDKQV